VWTSLFCPMHLYQPTFSSLKLHAANLTLFVFFSYKPHVELPKLYTHATFWHIVSSINHDTWLVSCLRLTLDTLYSTMRDSPRSTQSATTLALDCWTTTTMTTISKMLRISIYNTAEPQHQLLLCCRCRCSPVASVTWWCCSPVAAATGCGRIMLLPTKCGCNRTR
jgi:hypothetical protein